MSRSYDAIAFTARQKAELVEDCDDLPLGPDEIAGSTLYSLVSAGTEINGGYLGSNFPGRTGYAAVFRVEAVGDQVADVPVGQVRYCSGGHRSYQRCAAADTLPVPAELAPHLAPIARLMGVTMSTLTTTEAAPPQKVMVTGLGPVGHLGAQIFAACGYEVIAVDPDERRCHFARSAGLSRVFAAPPLEDQDFAGQIALHLECSGHEGAALDGAKMARKRGEIVQVATPWSRRTERYAHEVLHAVFFNYLVLRSGWEWEVPTHPSDFRRGSLLQNYAAALNWLVQGRVKVDHLCTRHSPQAAQQVYQSLLHNSAENLFQLFDWSR